MTTSLKVVLMASILGITITMSRAQSTIEIALSNNKIDFSFGGKLRLAGGFPHINKLGADTVSSLSQDDFIFSTNKHSVQVNIVKSSFKNSVGIYLKVDGNSKLGKDDFLGFFFSHVPGYKHGVSFDRYKPWNSWTKPVQIKSPGNLPDWDSQNFYWQYSDGLYGAAIPLSGLGYRTTLGSENGYFGSKALSYVEGFKADSVPQLVIGFGNDPYKLMNELYQTAMELIGSPENISDKKKFPAPLEYLGWCTWNASSMGAKLNEHTILSGVETFTKNNFPLGWVLIDDGWFNHRGSMLRSFKPDSAKFPSGFSPLIQTLKSKYNVKHVGVWHALNGYWNGIDPDSPLGREYKSALFSWKQPERVDIEDSPIVTYHFIKPESDSMRSYYRNFHRYLKSEGFSFIKVDNQLVVERMSVNNYPIGLLSKAMHQAMNASAEEYFGNAVINCMDMTSDAYYNFGSTPVARSVEDYFPYEEGENYNLQRGNAAAHVLQGIYNNLYFSQMVFPDLDMFQSHNPNGEFHAIARAINNGPIYVTDDPGKQNFKILNKLVLSNGKILRSDTPLLPTEDCLFQVQDKKPFKAFSISHRVGLLGIWNCADADQVSGTFSAGDIRGLEGERFVMYDAFTGKVVVVDRKSKLPITLERLKYNLYYVAPLKQGVGVLGLVNKYNSPAAMDSYTITSKEVLITLKEGGELGVYLPSKPKKVKAGNVLLKEYEFNDGLLLVNLNSHSDEPIVVRITL